MRPGPVARAVRGGLARRRVQTTVIAVVLLVSTGASVLALALLADSSSPFDHAFAAQHGADVEAIVDSSRATPAELVATGRLPGVTAAAGPFAEATVTAEVTGPLGGHMTLPSMTLAGRAVPGGPVDDITLQSGHWATQPGQIVLDGNAASNGLSFGSALGTKITVTGAPGKPVLTVVGIANSVTSSADGWVTPGEIASLKAAGSPDISQMLYRFSDAGTAAAVRADAHAVSAALPAGAVTGTQSYLTARITETSGIAPFTPFVVAFAIIGLVMSVLIVANVVSGAVVAGYRRIGILKSIGFTPGQVVAAYTGQVAVSALAGCLGGVALGNLLAIPLLSKTANAYGVGSLGVPFWADLVVPAAMCCLVGIAALLPALRAGRFSAVAAIAAGRAPRTGRGYAAHRLLGRLALPRPVSIGLAAPFARPARTTVTLVAVGLGAIAVTFAVGLSSSLYQVLTGLRHSVAAPVQIQIPSGPGGQIVRIGAKAGAHQGPPPGAVQPPTAAQAKRAITAALRAQPGTLRYVAQADQQVTVAGVTQQVAVTAFRGDASWIGYEMISGRWYSGPGQVDVPTAFLTATGKAVGDTLTIGYNGRQITVRIVGQVFDTENNGMVIITGWQTLASVVPGLAPDQYNVGLRAGISADTYAGELGARLGQAYFVGARGEGTIFPIIIGLIGTLTLLLTIMAGLGVLNTVVLHTRERVHDLGVFKAIGMTPRQTVAMVVCWVAGTGLAAGIVAVPAGIALHHYVLPIMAAAAGTGLPAVVLNVYRVPELIGLALAGVVIAVAAALLPASWAAAARTASALHAE